MLDEVTAIANHRQAMGGEQHTNIALSAGAQRDKVVLLNEIGPIVCKYLSTILETPVAIMVDDGLIALSSAEERIGQKHALAARVLRGELDEVAVTEEQASRDRRMRAGFNIPIDRQGERIASLGIAGDPISSQRAARLAVVYIGELLDRIAAERQRLSALAESFPGVIFQLLWRPEGNSEYLYVSDRVRNIYGVEPETVVADVARSTLRIHADDFYQWEQSISFAAVSMSDWEFEGRFDIEGGVVQWWQGIGHPVRSPAGETIFHGIIMDIDEKKRQEFERDLEREFMEKQAREIASLADQLHLTNLELQIQKSEFKRLSETDELTALNNRRFAFRLVESMLQEPDRERRPLSVCMLDIDKFKSINDRYGHDLGDTVLRNLAETMRQFLPSDVHLARLGGEEFLIVLDGHSETEASELVDRLREGVARQSVAASAGAITYTVSGGVAEWDGAESISHMLKRADLALYAAKSTGRNRILPSSTHSRAAEEPLGLGSLP